MARRSRRPTCFPTVSALPGGVWALSSNVVVGIAAGDTPQIDSIVEEKQSVPLTHLGQPIQRTLGLDNHRGLSWAAGFAAARSSS